VNSKKANNKIKAILEAHKVFLPKGFDSKQLSRNKLVKFELRNYTQKEHCCTNKKEEVGKQRALLGRR
jgi:hypothetical protein